MKQYRLRSTAEDKLNEIYRMLKSKKLRKEFEALQWLGDAERKVFSEKELDEIGVTPKVKEAYLKHRKFHDQVWRLMRAHRRKYGFETGYIEGHLPHLFENWNVYETETFQFLIGKLRIIGVANIEIFLGGSFNSL